SYALTRAAIEDPDPVILVENKALYGMAGELPDSVAPARIGQARIAREGTDVTLATYGAALFNCLKAADELASEGVSAEVVDLRSLQPWDKDAVLGSVAKT